jgi:hypothetical protein
MLVRSGNEVSNDEYEVHYIGVNCPHIFFNKNFEVVGAD